tara:strand:+ start:2725 stop:4509 length:1785 start_codon:yes stop_codon:yes gene_type:complete
MGFNLSDKVQNLNDAMFPGPNTANSNLLAAFGGESAGMSRDVTEKAAAQFYTRSAKPNPLTVAKGMDQQDIRQSIANRYALFNFQGLHGNLSTEQGANYHDSPSNPLMGGEQDAKNVSIGKIKLFFDEKYPKISYQESDFLYGKYFKKIPVNHLITLRRFPTPVADNIYSYNVRTKGETEATDATQVAGVTAVTYLGETAGNKLSEILKFSFGLKFKDLESKMEEIDTSSSGGGGYTKQPFYSKLGGIGKAVADTAKGVTPGAKFRAQNGAGSSTADQLGTTYANFVLGPINVVDTTKIRDRGLNFSNDVKLQFEYELKSLSYVNPKIAMIDIISNMLTMTTNNAQFFGGGHRYYGSAGFVASQFGDPNKLRNGDFSGYMGSLVDSISNASQTLFGDSNGDFSANSILDGAKKIGKTMLGNALGDFLGGQVGGPTGTTATRTFISGEPTGDWHITIGNPLNPIVMMGNMICDNSIMTLGAGLGYDDFPMEVKFEIDLKHGKPRDKGDIENMFNAGQGRIYASVPGVDDVLNLAGKETNTYGSVPAGNSDLQQSTNLPSAAALKKDEGSKKTTASANSTVSGAYVSNLTKMLIDS